MTKFVKVMTGITIANIVWIVLTYTKLGYINQGLSTGILSGVIILGWGLVGWLYPFIINKHQLTDYKLLECPDGLYLFVNKENVYTFKDIKSNGIYKTGKYEVYAEEWINGYNKVEDTTYELIYTG